MNLLRIQSPWSFLLLLLVLVNNASCFQNLFLPRTGHINPVPLAPSGVVAENLSNVTNFQSLLGAGRSLSYPFSAGMLLAISTIASDNNWKVSDTGFSYAVGLPKEEIVEAYGTLLDVLDSDENVTISNTLYSFRSNFSPNEALTETLMTEVREVTWTRETWKGTYDTMVEQVGNATNEKIDTFLIPSVTKLGSPFRRYTEAVMLSTFHYINGWRYPWSDGELGQFSGNEGIPFLKVEAQLFVAEEDEFTAVLVPLEGSAKSIVFVLPHVNLTSKYFRAQADPEQDETTDIVPFPAKWKLKTIRLQVPAFNTTDTDQYGQELEQLGMNETFCTIVRGFVGFNPYYLRPMVQVNYLDFNEDFLELASATGVAVEKLPTISSILGGSNNGNDEDEKTTTQKEKIHNNNSSSNNTSNQHASLPPNNLHSKASPDNTQNDNDIPTLLFNRPFLWYLNDSDVGPIFFGRVEQLVNLAYMKNSTENENESGNGGATTMPPSMTDVDMNTNDPSNSNQTETANSSILSEIDKYYLWSCRSFALAPPTATQVHQKPETPWEDSSPW